MRSRYIKLKDFDDSVLPTKFYVQSGCNQLLVTAYDEMDAAAFLMDRLLANPSEKIFPFVFVSRAGFVDDIKAYGTKKQWNDSTVFATYKVLMAMQEYEMSVTIRNYFEEDYVKYDV